jgi:hypothetical protein
MPFFSPGTKARAVGVRAFIRSKFARLPYMLRINPLPENRRLRDDAKFYAYVVEFWKAAAGRWRVKRKVSRTTLDFLHYINRIDTLLDQPNKNNFVTDLLSYRKDPLASKYISQFVSHVKELPISTREKQKLIKEANLSRKKMAETVQIFESIREPTVHEILRMREGTTGEVGKILFRILNIGHRIPEKEMDSIEKTFVNTFLMMQVVDDVEDYHTDVREKVSNILDAVLTRHPEERSKIPSTEITLSSCRTHAPDAYAELEKIAQYYMGKIPHENRHLKVAQALANLYWKAKERV